MTTTIAASLGHTLWTQGGTGASGGYDAIDRRRGDTAGLQEGVYAGTSMMVVQRAAGANMSVDIGASAHENGIAALVQGDAVTGQGLYVVPPHTATINETITTAHASLPRVDAVILEIQDDLHDSSGGNLARVRVVAGTATSGATLDNARDGSHGGAAIPNSALHLADVLVAGGATSISNSAIRDRRKWARGAYYKITRNANAAAGSNYSISSANVTLLDATNVAPRIECSGVPVRVTFMGSALQSGASNPHFIPQVDSTGMDGMASVGAAGANKGFNMIGDLQLGYTMSWTFTPSAGSHIIAPAFSIASGTLTLFAGTNQPLQWIVEELIHQDARNNSVSTG